MFFSTKQAFIIPGHCIAVQTDKSYNVLYIAAMTGLGEITIFFQKTQTGSKAIPVPIWRGPEGSEEWKFQISWQWVHEGSKVVSSTHRPPYIPGPYLS